MTITEREQRYRLMRDLNLDSDQAEKIVAFVTEEKKKLLSEIEYSFLAVKESNIKEYENLSEGLQDDLNHFLFEIADGFYLKG